MSRLVVTRPDGNVDVVIVAGAARIEGTVDATEHLQYRQPVWSPDGRTIAMAKLVQSDDDVVASLVLMDADTGYRNEIPLVFAPFFFHWRSDSGAIASLDASPLGLELWITDLLHGESTLLDRGAPLFFDWFGTELVAHIGPHPSDRLTSTARLIDLPPGQFTAPARHPRGVVVATASSDLVLLRHDGPELLAPVGEYARFAVAANGAIALVTSSPLSDGLAVVEADGSLTAIIDHPPIAMWWSPDSTTLLFLDAHLRAGRPTVRWHTWCAGELRDHSWYSPSATDTSEYLPFPEQYERAQTPWSPHSDAWCFAGAPRNEAHSADGIWIHRVDSSEPDWVCAGTHASWSPS
jgi:hypothetical protein